MENVNEEERPNAFFQWGVFYGRTKREESGIPFKEQKQTIAFHGAFNQLQFSWYSSIIT